jgi:glutathione peroxidase-family protein
VSVVGNGVIDILYMFSGIKWNFSKFLIDRNGVPIKRWAPTVDPKVRFDPCF